MTCDSRTLFSPIGTLRRLGRVKLWDFPGLCSGQRQVSDADSLSLSRPCCPLNGLPSVPNPHQHSSQKDGQHKDKNNTLGPWAFVEPSLR